MVKKEERVKKEMWKWIVCGVYIAFNIALSVGFRTVLDGVSVLGIDPYITEDNVSSYLEILSIHFTVVFLTTGLMSTLGSNVRMIYHVDIAQRVLIEPVGGNFRDMSLYAFVTLVAAVVAFVCRSAYVVIFSAFMGTVVVAGLFFKMISIYFGEEKWREKIKKEIKKLADSEEKDEEYNNFLQEIYTELRDNRNNWDVKPLAHNLALLFDLKYSCRGGEEAWKAEFVIDDIMLKIDNAEKFLELYLRILGIFTEKNSKCVFALNDYFMECVAKWPDSFDEKINNVLVYVFEFNETNPGIKGWIDDLQKQVASLKDEDFEDNSDYGAKTRFGELSEKVCKARLLATFNKMSVWTVDVVWWVFYDEFKMLVQWDEKRITDEEESYLDDISSFSGLNYVEDFENETGVYPEENHMWEAYVGDKIERGTVLFSQCFPSYAVRYGWKKRKELLKGYFEAYLEYSMEKDGKKEDYPFVGYGKIYQPKDPVLYETMRIGYLQGCAIQVMKGVSGIAETVAEMVVSFWSEVQAYKSSSELQSFYEFSFDYIGQSLLYADESFGNRRYNEKPECMLQFMEKLTEQIRKDSILRKMDMEITFGSFLDELEHLCPKYYDEATVEKVRRLIGKTGA